MRVTQDWDCRLLCWFCETGRNNCMGYVVTSPWLKETHLEAKLSTTSSFTYAAFWRVCSPSPKCKCRHGIQIPELA